MLNEFSITKILIILVILHLVMQMKKNTLCGLSADEIFELIEPSCFSRVHATRIANCVYKKRIADFDNETSLPKDLRKLLAETATSGIINYSSSIESSDGSVKYLFSPEPGRDFEAVFIPDKKRNTVCVSSQSGCRMACQFCMTAKYGFNGNLSVNEILSQVLALPQAKNITNVVFMGMGEPMDNLDNVLKAVEIMTAEWGMALGSSNITVSTVGLLNPVLRFLQESDCNLTLSLFSPFAEERAKWVPAERNTAAKVILDIINSSSVTRRRRFTVAYVMIKDINDSEKHLNALIDLLKGTKIRVNIVPYSSSAGSSLSPPDSETLLYFKHMLVTNMISASVRQSRGTDISAACGLLAAGRVGEYR